MEKLWLAGNSLSAAYAGSKGFQSYLVIGELLFKYYALVADADITCRNFLNGSMKAMRYHQDAFEDVRGGALGEAFKSLARTSPIARKMADTAGTLATKCESLYDLVVQALVATSEDNTIASERKRDIIRMVGELNSNKASLTSECMTLKTQVEDAKSDEKKAVEQADEARKMGFAIALVGTILRPFTDVAKALVGGHQEAKVEVTTQQFENIDKLVSQISENKSKRDKAERALEIESDEEKKKILTKDIADFTAEIKNLEDRQANCKSVLNSLREQKNKEAESASAREDRLHQERMRLQDLERKANADLAGAVERLKSTTEERDTIGQAIASLDLALQALGRITVVF